MKKLTWNKLAEAISKLSDEQKKKPVLLLIEDESQFRTLFPTIQKMSEDVYVNREDDEDIGNLEDLKYANGNFIKSNYKLSTRKGTPFLWDGI